MDNTQTYLCFSCDKNLQVYSDGLCEKCHNMAMDVSTKLIKERKMEKKFDSILKQLLKIAVSFAKQNGWSKEDFTVMLHDLWGDDKD
jgi:hypothetical protein